MSCSIASILCVLSLLNSTDTGSPWLRLTASGVGVFVVVFFNCSHHLCHPFSYSSFDLTLKCLQCRAKTLTGLAVPILWEVFACWGFIYFILEIIMYNNLCCERNLIFLIIWTYSNVLFSLFSVNILTKGSNSFLFEEPCAELQRSVYSHPIFTNTVFHYFVLLLYFLQNS